MARPSQRWLLGLITAALLIAAIGQVVRLAVGRRSTGPTAMAADLGEIWADDRPSGVVRVRNPSGQALPVSRVSTTCGCVVLGAAPETIPPGAEASIPFELHMNRDAAITRLDASVIIAIEGRAPLIAPIRARVLRASPAAVGVGRVLRGQVHPPATFLVRTRPGSSLRILRAEYDRALFDIEWDEPAAEAIEVRVRSRPDAPYGSHERGLVLHTSDADRSPRLVTLMLHVAHPFELRPEDIGFGDVEPGGAARAAVAVLDPYGRGVRAARLVEASPPLVALVEQQPGADGPRLVFELRDRPGRRLIHGTLTLAATVGDEPVERVVRFHARRRGPDEPAASPSSP